jgi:4,5-dihydroxyphthalate decarboxylase
MRTLSIAIGSYGVTRALKEKRLVAERLPLDFVEVSPITAAMRRMVRTLDFDVCEMAFTTYLCAKALGKPITAIPVFLTRNFHQWAAFHNVAAGIRAPKDLEGRRVLVNRGYTVTTGLWVRGILKSEYGVDLDSITWMPTDEEHVAEYRAPANVDYAWRGKASGELLASGAAAAGIGDIKTDAPEVRPLVPEAREAGFDYYRRTGIYPINHGVVVRDEVLAAEPWIAAELVALFAASKARYLAELGSGAAQSPADETARALGRVVGDPFPFGVAANRKALEAIVGFAVDQKVIPRRLALDELFAPGTLDLIEEA